MAVSKVKPATKPTIAKAAAAKPAAAVPRVVAAAKAIDKGEIVLKKDIIDKVVERSGIKKKDAKPVIEAMLAEMGDALGRGEQLVLQPLGKVMVKRRIDQENATVFTCKVRQSKQHSAAAQATDTGSDTSE